LPILSIVICTYNRADILAGAIESIVEQDFNPGKYELLIIDNNSTDRTYAVVNEFKSRYGNIRYLFEPEQGLSHARNRGWRESRGSYVGYIDDDCRASPGWLKVAEGVIERFAPDVFGGPYIAIYDGPKPQWFRYGSHIRFNESRRLEMDEYGALTGGNIFFRKSILERMNGFDPRFGVKGERTFRGEETALLNRLVQMEKGVILYYETTLIVYHLVSRERMKMRWAVKENFAGGQCAYLLSGEGGDKGIIGKVKGVISLLLLTSLGILWHLSYGFFLRDRKRYPFYKNYLWEKVLPLFQNVGRSYELIFDLMKERRNGRK
jgi:glycosyltransferase involved in cell wall biosynthesis